MSDANIYRALDSDALDPEPIADADAVLANGELVAARCIELGADPAKVVTLHEPIDREVFAPEGESQGPDGSPRLVTLAGKGLELAIQACALAAVRQPNLKLVIIGDSERDLPSFASAVSPGDDAEFARRMRWADALLITNAADAGMLPRAFACGTPCVGPEFSAIDEIATHRWDSLLVECTPKRLAAAIADIAEPELQARLAAPARTSSEPFDAQAVKRRRRGILAFLTRQEYPKVSVVLPTYNRAKLLEAAVSSVLDQNYPNLELIVVNDGSTDGTRELLDGKDNPRLRVVHQENQGLPRALNRGFKEATGEYWTWTSDDNRYRQGAIAAMVRELELEPDAGLVYTDMVITMDSGKTRPFVGGPPERLAESNCVGACFLYRADAARQAGEYDPDFALVEDHDYWLRLRRHAPLIWLRRVLYEYADSPDTLSRQRFLDVQSRRMRLLEREHKGSADWSDRKVQILCRDTSYSKQAGLPLAALSSAIKALREQPGNGSAWRALLRAVTPRPLLRLSRTVRRLDAR